jgi:hypothetical protein
VTSDKFRCICDPDDIFEPPDPRPVAVEGCPAHRFRRAAQQMALQLAAEPPHPTCIDVTGNDQPPCSAWTCGPDCPKEA